MQPSENGTSPLPHGLSEAVLQDGPGAANLDLNSILVEEYKHAVIVLNQYRNSTSRLLGTYLLGGGVLATGLGVVVKAYDSRDIDLAMGLELVQIIALAAAGALSLAIYVGYFELVREYRRSLSTLQHIRMVYSRYAGTLRGKLRTEITKTFGHADRPIPYVSSLGGSTAFAMLFLAAPLGSLCFVGAFGHVLGFVHILLYGHPLARPHIDIFLGWFPLAVEITLFAITWFLHIVYYYDAVVADRPFSPSRVHALIDLGVVATLSWLRLVTFSATDWSQRGDWMRQSKFYRLARLCYEAAIKSNPEHHQSATRGLKKLDEIVQERKQSSSSVHTHTSADGMAAPVPKDTPVADTHL